MAFAHPAASPSPKTISMIHSPSPMSASNSSSSRSPLTFREIESPRQQWSEKEKADKWDDLLMRSDQAGGTLHIGAGDTTSGLMSDAMRLSMYSENPDVEGDD